MGRRADSPVSGGAEPPSLDHLFDRNVAWAQQKTLDDPTFFVRMAEQQSPRLLWIGCSDSRVTANDVLGLDPGEVFVQRNIANMVHTSDMNLLAVLEFAIEVLQVQHIIVCGHYGCGGIRRALGNERTALVDHWLQPVVMLYRKHRAIFDAIADPEARIDRMCELNIEMQVRRVAAIPTVENAWLRGQPLRLHGWIYGIHDGLLRNLGPTLASIAGRDALPSIDERVLHPVEPTSGVRRHAIDAFTNGGIGDCCVRAEGEAD
jgi:carbonic anhydrase